jgi:hypothetical protein
LIEDEVAILINDAEAPKAAALLEQAGFNVKMPASKESPAVLLPSLSRSLLVRST